MLFELKQQEFYYSSPSAIPSSSASAEAFGSSGKASAVSNTPSPSSSVSEVLSVPSPSESTAVYLQRTSLESKNLTIPT